MRKFVVPEMAYVTYGCGARAHRDGPRPIDDHDAMEVELFSVIAQKDPIASGFIERLDSTNESQRASNP
ncbi:MAG: hypothetical protein ACYC1I_00970 [Acidimicrobiales bacterium]